MNPQTLMFNAYLKETRYLKQFRKCANWGEDVTAEFLWAKLPPISKTYWENKFYLTK